MLPRNAELEAVDPSAPATEAQLRARAEIRADEYFSAEYHLHRMTHGGFPDFKREEDKHDHGQKNSR